MTRSWVELGETAIAALPATIAAVGVLLNRRALRTRNGQAIGELVQETHDVAHGTSSPESSGADDRTAGIRPPQ